MDSEVFSNAPLQLVACEITFGDEVSGDHAALLTALRTVVPEPVAVEFAVPLLKTKHGTDEAETALFRIVGRQNTIGVTVWRSSLVIEDTDYVHFAGFSELVHDLVAAWQAAQGVRAVARIGLRYIDELHVSVPVSNAADWSPYVGPALSWTQDLCDASPEGVSTFFTMSLGPEEMLAVRTAMVPNRALVSVKDGLRLRQRPEGPAFILDCDASHAPVDVPAARYDADVVVERLGVLRAAAGRMFGRVFTDAARDVFRGMK